MSGQLDSIGVDIGGSGVRTARVVGGEITGINRVSLGTRSVAAVIDAVASVVPSGDAPVGVGVPGFVRQGSVLSSPNFPEWCEVDLTKLLRARLERPVFVLNDANAAALGAAAQRPESSLMLLTFGTGVGGGVVIDGQLRSGGRQTGTELGHVFAGGEQRCGCGGRGCLETWTSTVGLCRAAADAGHPVANGEAVVKAAQRGESWAKAILMTANRALGVGLATLVNLYAPEVVLLAGGLARPGIWTAAIALFEDRVIACNRCPVEVIGPADRFAILGAADWALQRAAAPDEQPLSL